MDGRRGKDPYQTVLSALSKKDAPAQRIYILLFGSARGRGEGSSSADSEVEIQMKRNQKLASGYVRGVSKEKGRE